MSVTPSVDAEILRLVEAFGTAGAQLVDLPILQPSDTLLDLYGEDIRARAYTTRDPLDGELMLRPDFTVPVVQMHMSGGANPARYAYAGKVFRTQELDAKQPPEYEQVGFEIFDASNPVEADAEVFALIASVLPPGTTRAAIGDIGVLMAAVAGLDASEARKAALKRHIWRPRRFRALLDRYSGRTPMTAERKAMLEAYRNGVDVVEEAGPLVGLRTCDEVRARLERLAAEAEAEPLSSQQTDLLQQIVTLDAAAPDALERLRDIAVDIPSINTAVERLSDRLGALERRGIDVAMLSFAGGYGRSTMEYYDGFVFGFTAVNDPELPPVATGGRYDALVRALGAGDAIPAVGGVVRPALSLRLARAD